MRFPEQLVLLLCQVLRGIVSDILARKDSWDDLLGHSDADATLAKLLEEKGSGRGLISICAAGGQGVTAILER